MPKVVFEMVKAGFDFDKVAVKFPLIDGRPCSTSWLSPRLRSSSG
jgi:hypothetical protein